jgi:hypothetical protein
MGPVEMCSVSVQFNDPLVFVCFVTHRLGSFQTAGALCFLAPVSVSRCDEGADRG